MEQSNMTCVIKQQHQGSLLFENFREMETEKFGSKVLSATMLRIYCSLLDASKNLLGLPE
jgi:hypothetical protein